MATIIEQLTRVKLADHTDNALVIRSDDSLAWASFPNNDSKTLIAESTSIDFSDTLPGLVYREAGQWRFESAVASEAFIFTQNKIHSAAFVFSNLVAGEPILGTFAGEHNVRLYRFHNSAIVETEESIIKGHSLWFCGIPDGLNFNFILSYGTADAQPVGLPVGSKCSRIGHLLGEGIDNEGVVTYPIYFDFRTASGWFVQT